METSFKLVQFGHKILHVYVVFNWRQFPFFRRELFHLFLWVIRAQNPLTFCSWVAFFFSCAKKTKTKTKTVPMNEYIWVELLLLRVGRILKPEKAYYGAWILFLVLKPVLNLTVFTSYSCQINYFCFALILVLLYLLPLNWVEHHFPFQTWSHLYVPPPPRAP